MSFLVVLGCHRSGTSALTGLMSALGFQAGKSLMQANQFNERGYFEDLAVGSQNEGLLQSLGRSWKDERPLPIAWESSEVGVASIESLCETLRSSFDLDKPCILKDPRVCRLLPVYDKAFLRCGITPKYIFSLRSPYAVVASLNRRDGIANARAALLYLAYLMEAERLTRGKPRIFVRYEDLLADWRGAIGIVAQDLQIPALLPSALSGEAMARADHFLTPELDHAPAAQEGVGNSRPMQLALALYACLCAPQDEQASLFLDALYIEWQKYLESIEPWLSEAVDHERLKESLPQLLMHGGDASALLSQQSAASYLHWASPNFPHCGENTRRLTWQFGVRNQQRFVLPVIVEPVSELRWDITECPAYCKVAAVWIESPTGHTVWAWEKGQTLLTAPSPDLGVLGTNDEGFCELISLDSDPYGVIHVPLEVLDQLQEGWTVCADWYAYMPTQGIKPVLARMVELLASLGHAQQKLQFAQNALDLLQRDSANESKALKGLQQERHRVRAEIIRVEAQIEMLKELFVLEKDGIQ